MNIANGCAPSASESEIAKFLRLINQERGNLQAELEVLCQKLHPVLGLRALSGDSDGFPPAGSPIGIALHDHLTQLEGMRLSVNEINQTLAI